MISVVQSPNLETRASRLMPGGVNSPVRSFGAVGMAPLFIERADGCRLWDANGRPYIDLIGSWGAAILGHAHPAVTEAIHRAAAAGASFGLTSPGELELAQEIIRRVRSIDRVRLVNSGTEAVMSAIRVARAATGRSMIVKLEGCYHGHADDMLTRAGSGVAMMGLQDSADVFESSSTRAMPIPFGSLGAARELFAAHGDQIAAVIAEPIAGNMGVIPPPDGYLESLRTLTRQFGALLVLDEVMTGFRVARGGAQDLLDLEPDLTTFGKIIGGGLPVGAFGGRRDLMELVAPAGPVYQAGTMSGNPVVVAAGLSTLEQLDDAAYERLELLGARLERGLRGAVSALGFPTSVQRVGSMISVFFGIEVARDFTGAVAADQALFAKFFREMLAKGVLLPPSGLESWFISLAHDEPTIDQIVEAARASIDALRNETIAGAN